MMKGINDKFESSVHRKMRKDILEARVIEMRWIAKV